MKIKKVTILNIKEFMSDLRIAPKFHIEYY